MAPPPATGLERSVNEVRMKVACALSRYTAPPVDESLCNTQQSQREG
jgi:hypothetical protein